MSAHTMTIVHGQFQGVSQQAAVPHDIGSVLGDWECRLGCHEVYKNSSVGAFVEAGVIVTHLEVKIGILYTLFLVFLPLQAQHSCLLLVIIRFVRRRA